jgi:hypothetical protein
MKKIMLKLGVRVIYGQTARVTVFLIEVAVTINIFYNCIKHWHKNLYSGDTQLVFPGKTKL